MSSLKNSTPVLIGVGQSIFREPVSENAASPADIAAEAAEKAIHDAGGTSVANEIDTLCTVRIFADSYLKSHHPCGGANNLPGAIAKRLSIDPKQLIYSDVGGQSPQRLVNEMAERIFEGEVGTALLTGVEAIAYEKQARRSNVALDWNEHIDSEFEDRGLGKQLVSGKEIAHGMIAPMQIYPLFEHAWRVKHNLTREQHRSEMGKLFASFNQVACENEYAFFPQPRTVEDLIEVSEENYITVDPYTKRIVAQDAVNMGAAVLMTSVEKARQMNIPEEKWVFLHGYADVDDKLVSQRSDLARSNAIAKAGCVALDAARVSLDEINYIDLYSCFPCAVLTAAEAFGLDWRDQSKALTVTGGLPFVGGAGNNYSMHAIATMVEKLRDNASSFGLVQANGGFLSKQSVGIYSTTQPVDWQPCSSEQAQKELDDELPMPRASDFGQAFTVETYAVVYKRAEPIFAYVFALDTNQNRVIAKVKNDDVETLNLLVAEDPAGKKIQISAGDKANYFTFQ